VDNKIGQIGEQTWVEGQTQAIF